MNYHSKIDADIDSLTSMLADLDSHTQDSVAQVMKERFIYLPQTVIVFKHVFTPALFGPN